MEKVQPVTVPETIRVPEIVAEKDRNINSKQSSFTAIQREREVVEGLTNEELTDEELKDEVEKEVTVANKLLNVLKNELKFISDDRSRTGVVVQLINKETGDLVRQIPPEELLNLVGRLKDTVVGILIDNNA